jgi:AhpD family alkylhydroperoxidase
MSRIPLLDENAHPDFASLAEKIRGARGGTLQPVYRALMHSPGLAGAWFEFNNAVRFGVALDERTRELVIMRVAALTGCEFVWSVHEKKYAVPAGLAPAEIAALKASGAPPGFGAREAALLACVDAMTREVAVPEAVFAAMRREYGDRAAVEITVLAAAYNMQARVIVAFGLEPGAK